MELLQLRYFCEVVESGGFSSAAKKFGIGTSSLSQTMRQFEAESGLQLFERYPNKIKISETGHKYYTQIKRALSMLDSASDSVAGALERMEGNINICINTNRRIVTDAINAFHHEYPDVTFTINHKISSLQSDSPERGGDEIDYDIIIADSLSERILGDYDKQLLLSEKILLAVSNKNKILRHKKIPPKLLAEQDYITMSPGYSLYSCTLSICRAMGFMPKISIKCGDAAAVRQYIEMGFGVSFVPEISWKGQFSDMIVLRDVGDFNRETKLYLRKYRTLPRRIRIFIDFLTKEFAKSSTAEGLCEFQS